ncbi:hypothetical protein A2767_02350 [Candidatus Roizmanbacteria bacterium RIFCSPHIGHO2_01_FULL_35_10]|uniref:RDD domain-containing protein n=1 Tax=Candidatus Roizmanbacteria bacterium RIFCSPLOWO2_01_FULL_35_13 TaxID=1802055 RepID=A0A1F7I6Z1_9BACT|nr:MAG: hypothetical protein A2767_02350 [Candidatus Roizmanbacteria bacterium RIFCSPHIGHO2_01_FULL_35_10]OGK39121.1 MAG: hypothetical protein A3A74_08300 [Candidatus Roizmanbacteria bacterium RIFCSPLOWO2_01_FULL_35_13]
MNNNYSSLYASFFERLGAIAVDWLIILFIFFVLRTILALFIPSSLLPFIILIIFPIFSVLYNVLFIYKTGRTPGKRIVGIKVINEVGTISFGKAFLREAIFKPLSFILLGSGFIYMFFNQKKQTYYDKVLNLVVLKQSQASWVKKIFLIIIIIGFVLYLIQLIMIPVAFYRFYDDDKKSFIIESIQEKIKIVEISRPLVKKYGSEAELDKIKAKQQELCSNRFFGIFGNKDCQLEELDLQSLRDLEQTYEQAINYIVNVQSKIDDSQSPTPTQTDPGGETNNWKTYVNLYYSFKYPPDWFLKEPIVFGSGYESDFEYSNNLAFRLFEQSNSNPKTNNPYSFNEFMGDTIKYESINDIELDKQPAKHLFIRGSVPAEEEVIVFLPHQRAILSFYYQPSIYKKNTMILNQILSTFKFNDDSNEVVGIRLDKCCTCPATIPLSIIGQNSWIDYDDYIDSKGPYVNYSPQGCLDKVCSPCSSIPERGISQIQLETGWYWGNINQKLAGTPDDWIFTGAGKTTCWHKSNINCY